MITPPLIKRFHERYPHVEIELRNILTQEQMLRLQDRKIDVGFLRMPLTASHEIRTRVIHREPFVLLVPATHPLAGKKDLVLSDCKDANFVMYTRRMAPGFHDQILNLLHRHGITPHVIQEAAEMYTLISLVATELGVAIAPASIALHHAENVVVRTIPGESALSEIAIAWNRTYVSATAQLFLQMVFEGSRTGSRAKNKPKI